MENEKVIENQEAADNAEIIDASETDDLGYSGQEIADDRNTGTGLRFLRRASDCLKQNIKILLCLNVLGIVCAGAFYIQNGMFIRAFNAFQAATSNRINTRAGYYEGDSEFGLFNGTGTFTFSDQAVYTGSFVDGKISGIGVIIHPESGTYEGSFEGGKKNGTGKMTWLDGSVYEGEFLNDVISGQGKYVSEDGTLYEGSFFNNRLKEGTCKGKNGDISFDLTFANPNSGKGNITFAEGAVYTGDFEITGAYDLVLSGNGETKYPNGDQYCGSYSSGRRSGTGIYTWSNGATCEGIWKNDGYGGSFNLAFADGTKLHATISEETHEITDIGIESNHSNSKITVTNGKFEKITYEHEDGTEISGSGELKDLKGRCEIMFPNGDKYSGDFSNGTINGYGKYTWASGESYYGSWKNGIMDGDGTYTYLSDSEIQSVSGKFQDGIPSGKCELTLKDGTTKMESDWYGGRCVKVYE